MTDRLRIFLLSCVAIIFASVLVFSDARGQDRPKKPCADDLASCPMTGCEEEGTEHGLYRDPEIVTRGRFPDGGESDSTWRTQEARHVGSDTIAPGF